VKIKTKGLNSVYRFAAVMVVLCILPSGAFASENKTAFTPGENVTNENFADIQAQTLDSVNEQITELQSFYTNVSKASSASDLQKVLSNQRCAGMPHGMNMGPGEKGHGFCGVPGLFDVSQLENVTDDNYTDVQAKMVSSLGNMTEMLNSQVDNTTDENRTKMLNEQITDLENLSSKISAASSAEELQNVVFSYLQTQTTDSLKLEIEHLEKIESETKNTTDKNMSETLSSRITELNGLIEDINGAKSLENLKEIMFSSGMPGMGGPMHHGDNCPMGSGELPENSTEA
jgi:hypothetical protein